MYYTNGDRFEGVWKNNRKEGEGILFHENGNKETENYLNGKKLEKIVQNLQVIFIFKY